MMIYLLEVGPLLVKRMCLSLRCGRLKNVKKNIPDIVISWVFFEDGATLFFFKP